MIPVPVTIVAALILLSGCTTEPQRRAAENAAIEKQAAQETKRVCSLPQAERAAELERIRSESGVAIACGKD